MLDARRSALPPYCCSFGHLWSDQATLTECASARFGKERELVGHDFPRHAVGERGRIFAGEAMIGELRPRRIAALFAHGAIDAVDRKEGERIGADESAHALEIVRRSKQLVLLRRVDAVVVRMGD